MGLETMNKIICHLIRCNRVAQQEMIMGLDMNNVMDNNWILFCIRPNHTLNARARGLHCVYVSLVMYMLDVSLSYSMKPRSRE